MGNYYIRSVVGVQVSLAFTPPVMAGQLQWRDTFECDRCIEIRFPIQTPSEIGTPAKRGQGQLCLGPGTCNVGTGHQKY